MADRFQHRRDTKERWAQINPILMEGEVGYELDTDQYKLGDGIRSWNDLSYRGDPCVQQEGVSKTTPMSQDAVTKALAKKAATTTEQGTVVRTQDGKIPTIDLAPYAKTSTAEGKVVRTSDGTIPPVPEVDLSDYAKTSTSEGKVVRTSDGTIPPVPEVDLSDYAKTSTSEGKVVRTSDGKVDLSAKADGCRLTDDNKLQLTSAGEDIGTPLELPTGILNLSYKENIEFEDSNSARKTVKTTDRILGQAITYKLNDGMWVLDQFIGESVASWDSEGSWVNYALVRDLSPILLELESIRGQVAGIESAVNRKIDGGYTEDLDENTIELVLTSNGEEVSRIQLPKGGGGGGTGPSGVVMRLKAVGSTSLVVGENSDAIIRYNWTSIDQETGDDTGSGTVYITVNGIPIYNGETDQGDNQYNLQGRLNLGSNNVTVRVTDGYNNVRSVSYRVQKASLILTSTFADDNIYKTVPVAFRYTPIGTGEKKIRFWLNDQEIDSDTTTASGKQLTKNLSNLIAGSNSIRVIAESNIDGSQLTSNELYYEFIFADATIVKPVITISLNSDKVAQFDTIAIPYMVYDPNNLNANIELLINGVVQQKLSVPRSRQYWTHSFYEQDSYTMEIKCGDRSKSVVIEVVASEYDIVEEKGDLEYKVNALGKSNFSDDRASWKYKDHDAIFKNFSWSEDGWQRDNKNISALKLIGDANVEVGINPFNASVTTMGMSLTIEYSTENVADREASIIKSDFNGIGIEITPTSVMLKSSQSNLSAKLDSSTKTSITFTIQKIASSRLLLLFIDGVMSGALQYPESDNFAQTKVDPLKLSTGNRGCTTYIYGIRWYKNDLNYSQVLGNYIFDIEKFEDKLKVYTRNDIIDDYGTVDLNKILEFLPCLTFIGDLPMAKGNKKTCNIVYEDRQNPENSFVAEGVENDVQGTSSADYPRKNYKFKFKKGLTLTETGEVVSKYALKKDQIPVSVFCLKAQFIESSCSHDTGLANTVDEVFRTMGYKTKPQETNDKVRAVIYGKPIIVFHKKDNNAPAEFIGKYSFNNDKSTEDTFGFTPGCESWEFKNNASPRSLFRSDDFDDPTWKADFDSRYPDQDSSLWDPSNMRKVFTWVLSCKGNPAKFKKECSEYFKVDWLVFYCLWTEVTGSVDARAKNQFLTTFGEKSPNGQLLWLFLPYDLKTTLGINNQGRAQFDYNIEVKDKFESGNVWNGWDSLLWDLVTEAYQPEITKLYQLLRQKDALTFPKFYKHIQEEIVDKWCENVYNQDGFYKYIELLFTENNSAYLYALQGSRTRHRTWWLKNRFAYMDGKYSAGDYKNDFAVMRLYTPTEWKGIVPNADFDLTLAAHSYLQVKYGSQFTDPLRGFAGETYKIDAPAIKFNDTETAIYGISTVKSLGNLAPKYLGSVDISKAIALEELIVGSNAEGYVNLNLKSLGTGSNEMLRLVNVANCPNLKQSLELSKCYSLEEVEARGSGITGISLPDSGVIKAMRLPASLTALVVKNQVSLQTLSLEGYANLNTIIVDNVPLINGYSFVKSCLEITNNKLGKVRLTNIDAIDTSSKTLMALVNMNGEDDNGTPTDHAVVTGKIHINSISQSAYDTITLAMPYLKLSYDVMLNVIEFEDSNVRRVMVSKYDTNGDGEVSVDEVQYKNIPAGTLTGSGAKYFDEARFWGGTGTMIDNCQTLERLSIQSGKAEILDLPALKQLSIYSQHETIDAAPQFGYNTVKNCFNIEKFILSGRYIETAKKGAILAREFKNNIEYYRFRLPLRGYSSLTIDEKLVMSLTDASESTYNWGKDLQQLTLKNVKEVDLPYFEKLDTLLIQGFSEHSGNKLELNDGILTLQNLIIDDKTGNSLDLLRITGGRIRNIEFRSLVCKGAQGSFLQFTGSSGTKGLLSRVDCPASYQPASIYMSRNHNNGDYFPFADNAILILRSPNFIPLASLDYPSAYVPKLTVYVPDGLVSTYKAASNWNQFGNSNKIQPISNLG